MIRAAVVAVLALVVPPDAPAAQVAVRVKWPLVDIVVRGDSTGELRVIWSPNLWTTVTGSRVTRLRMIRVEAIDGLQWAKLMRRLVDSAAERPAEQGLVMLNPALQPADGDGNAIQIAKAQERGKPPFRLYLIDSAGAHAWEVLAARDEIGSLLTAVEDVAGAAVFPEQRAARPRRREDVAPCWLPGPGDDVQEEDNVQERPVPVTLPDLVYPLRAYPDEGRVWVQFIIDTTGVVERGSPCVLLTDSRLFVPVTIDAIVDIRFRPGRIRGVGVRTLSLVEFQFHTRR